MTIIVWEIHVQSGFFGLYRRPPEHTLSANGWTKENNVQNASIIGTAICEMSPKDPMLTVNTKDIVIEKSYNCYR